MKSNCLLALSLAFNFCSLAFTISPQAAPIRRYTTNAAPMPRAQEAAIVILDNKQKRAYDCKGRNVVIQGNQNILTLRGDCSNLIVDGNENTVTVESVAAIATNGNRNKVTWMKGAQGKPPRISNPGNGNTITRGGR